MLYELESKSVLVVKPNYRVIQQGQYFYGRVTDLYRSYHQI